LAVASYFFRQCVGDFSTLLKESISVDRRNAISLGAATLVPAVSTGAQSQDHAHHHHQMPGGKYQALAACAQSVSQAKALAA
jgi:hypothetical protein